MTIKQLERTQNAAARVLTGLKRTEHIAPVVKPLHSLRVIHTIDWKVDYQVD